MTIKSSLLLLSLLGIFAACGPKATKETKPLTESDIQLLEEEVMRLHDSVMPQTSEIMRYKRKFQEQTELSEDSLSAESFKNAALELEQAYHLMMDWMQAYHAPDPQSSLEAREAYLLDELNKVQEVVDAYTKALSHAHDLDSLR